MRACRRLALVARAITAAVAATAPTTGWAVAARGVGCGGGLGIGCRSAVASLGLRQGLRGAGSGHRGGGGRRCGILFWHVVGHGVADGRATKPSIMPALRRQASSSPFSLLLCQGMGAPLLLAGNAIAVAIHLHARTALKKKLGFGTGSHLRAMLAAIAPKRRRRQGLRCGGRCGRRLVQRLRRSFRLKGHGPLAAPVVLPVSSSEQRAGDDEHHDA